MNLTKEQEQKILTNKVIDIALRLAFIFLITALCFQIIKPFIIMVVWGIIIAVAIFPLYNKLSLALGGRFKLAAILYTLFALSLLIGPSIMITGSLVETTSTLAKGFHEGTLTVPPPAQSVNEWPLVGDEVYALWSQASNNLEETLKQNRTQVKELGEAFISAVAGVSGGILQFIVSIIISGVFLANNKSTYAVTIKIVSRLRDKDQGLHYTNLAVATIRSVAQGVLGVALIQAILGGAGMYVMDIPGWGLWTVFILILAVAQLPPLLILLPAIVYVFSVADTTPAIIFSIWSIIVSMSDGLLKPLLLGRGMDTPTLVILLGAIGGMIWFGILGLFVGAIALALGYEHFMAWLDTDTQQA
ncbi:AI-2E family transporter [Methylococcaceae bacterium CS1]|nr:AI-2E family transporter [Methyloprofundus sp.]TXK95967.1 AI-2E family transporter [Methylococcaceae bacterium CS5]TXK96067.1 AI-2E family transporter [Methylococcaceae bacterium CS4]TXL05658.1 AI-2E family transporter [Methylococcaceae bacterium CS1]TXL06200.1 AI-2E family transporter [Methylococcaceae bacterium CS3]TXL10326.1 AI-2E family transporter [Methylococcaceae bacterium CS2]